jgi:hypothetical protein
MKAERFIADRRRQLTPRGGLRFALMGTPLLLEDGRVDITDRRLHQLLQEPPRTRKRGGAELSGPYAVVRSSLKGLRAQEKATSTLDMFRSGHVEYVLLDSSYLMDDHPLRMRAWAAAEFVVNFVLFVDAIKQLSGIADPYLFTVSIWFCAGVKMPEYMIDRFGRREANQFDEAEHLLLDPIMSGADETSAVVAQRITDRFWNAFQYVRCPFFDAQGRFVLMPL